MCSSSSILHYANRQIVTDVSRTLLPSFLGLICPSRLFLDRCTRNACKYLPVDMDRIKGDSNFQQQRCEKLKYFTLKYRLFQGYAKAGRQISKRMFLVRWPQIFLGPHSLSLRQPSADQNFQIIFYIPAPFVIAVRYDCSSYNPTLSKHRF